MKATMLMLILACSLAAQQPNQETSSAIVSDVPCTADVGMPTCFPHNDLIDWSRSNVAPGPIARGRGLQPIPVARVVIFPGCHVTSPAPKLPRINAKYGHLFPCAGLTELRGLQC